MRVSAKADYAVRAALELAAAGDGPVKGERIAEAQGIPLKFLENILIELRHEGIVRSQRGPEGGYWLARPADEIAIAEVIRAVEGPAGQRARRAARGHPSTRAPPRSCRRSGWRCARNLRAVLEEVTLADVVRGRPARRGGEAGREAGRLAQRR